MNPAKPTASLAETLSWGLLAFLGAFAMLVFRPTPLFHDSYQYLSAAEHVQRDHQVATSLIHFDTERSHGRIPAPLTSFAPGYPVLIAMTSAGGDFEGAGRFLSCVGYAGTAALLAWALMLAGVSIFVRQAVLLLYVTNAVALTYATAVLSDEVYMQFSTGAVAALIWAEDSLAPKRVVTARVLAAMAAASVACLVRYVGLFLIAGFIGYAVLRPLLPGSRFRGVFLVSTLLPLAIAGSMMLRNEITVGTWKGGNNVPAHHPAASVLTDYARSQLQVLAGPHPFTFGRSEYALLAGVLGIAGLFFAALYNALPRHLRAREINRAALVAALSIAVYTAALAYACLTSLTTFETRYLLPMLPLDLLLFGMAMNWLASRCSTRNRRLFQVGMVLIAAGYIGVNARDFPRHRAPSPLQILAAEFDEPDGEGRPLRQWVDSHLPAKETIIAADGQAIGFLLHRPTLSMISDYHSAVRWECDEVKNEMRRFHASFVILPKISSSPDQDELLAKSRFIAASASAEPPCGFTVAAENSAIRILEWPAQN